MKMDYIHFLFTFMWLFGLVISIPHPIQHADNNTKCEFAQLPTGYIPIGKTISVPGECMLVTCQQDLTIAGLTCPMYFLFPGCHLTETDNFKEYPDCCPQIICKFSKVAFDAHHRQSYSRK